MDEDQEKVNGGRRMYELMVYWETAPTVGQPSHLRDFVEIWRTNASSPSPELLDRLADSLLVREGHAGYLSP